MALYDLDESCFDEDFDVAANLPDAQAKEVCQTLLRGPTQSCLVVGVICKGNIGSPAVRGNLRFEKYFYLWDSGELALFRHAKPFRLVRRCAQWYD